MAACPPKRYSEVTLEVPRQNADAVGNFIVENIASGLILEEEDGGAKTAIRFYVPNDLTSRQQSELREYLEEVLESDTGQCGFSTRPVENIEWVEQYRKSIQAVTIADNIVVRPPWLEPETDAEYDIIIEPKMAFGTGTHETTRSCLDVIRCHFDKGGRFLDLGCGSGILAILADKMGASYIKAIDYDVVAVENCRENFSINGVTARHDILFGTIEKAQRDMPYDFVCANIIKSTILPIIPTLWSLTREGGVLVMSGLLDNDEDEMTAAMRAAGIASFDVVRDNRWLTFIVTGAESG